VAEIEIISAFIKSCNEEGGKVQIIKYYRYDMALCKFVKVSDNRLTATPCWGATKHENASRHSGLDPESMPSFRRRPGKGIFE